MISTSGLVEKTRSLLLSGVTNEVPSAAVQKNATWETKHPLVQSIWKMLEKGIPVDYMNKLDCTPHTWCQKSTTEAIKLRKLGNQSYDLKNFDEASMFYSQSVAAAPTDSEELALAYGNRSSILEYKKEYELCLLDLNRALDGPLPQSTRQKLLQRKAMTWEKLREQNFFRSKLKEGISRIKRGNEERANLRACERKLCHISQVGIDDVDLKIDYSQIDDPIWQTKFDNTVLENVSPKIELKYDDQLGPHLIAKDDIEPGEAVCLDDLYTFTSLAKMKYNHCSYCLTACEGLIPCPQCTWEMYCSARCREKAYDTYHRVECKLLPLWKYTNNYLHEIRVHILRTFLRATKQGSELANLMNSPTVRQSLDGNLTCPNVQFSSENYSILVNVVSRFRYSNYEDTIWCTSVIGETLAVFVGLRSILFFGNEDSKTQCSGNTLNALEYFGIQLLVHLVSLMGCQAILLPGGSIESLGDPIEFRYTALGYGFFQWRCFTQHSCDPNVHFIVNKRRMLVYSARSIKVGEQIFFGYTATYTQKPREERQIDLKSIGGQECTCTACVEHWPMLVALQQRPERYHVRDKNIVRKIEKMRKWLMRIKNSTIGDDNMEKLVEVSSAISQYVKGPSVARFYCERLIHRCIFIKGDLHINPKYIASLQDDL